MSQNSSPIIQKNYVSPMTRRIEDWKSRLIDLSRRNNLLYFQPSKRGNLSVSRPNVETIFNGLVLKKRHLAFWLPPEEPENSQGKSQTKMNLSSLPFETSRPAANQLVCEGVSRADLERTLKNLNRRSL